MPGGDHHRRQKRSREDEWRPHPGAGPPPPANAMIPTTIPPPVAIPHPPVVVPQQHQVVALPHQGGLLLPNYYHPSQQPTAATNNQQGSGSMNPHPLSASSVGGILAFQQPEQQQQSHTSLPTGVIGGGGANLVGQQQQQQQLAFQYAVSPQNLQQIPQLQQQQQYVPPHSQLVGNQPLASPYSAASPTTRQPTSAPGGNFPQVSAPVVAGERTTAPPPPPPPSTRGIGVSRNPAPQITDSRSLGSGRDAQHSPALFAPPPPPPASSGGLLALPIPPPSRGTTQQSMQQPDPTDSSSSLARQSRDSARPPQPRRSLVQMGLAAQWRRFWSEVLETTSPENENIWLGALDRFDHCTSSLEGDLQQGCRNAKQALDYIFASTGGYGTTFQLTFTKKSSSSSINPSAPVDPLVALTKIMNPSQFLGPSSSAATDPNVDSCMILHARYITSESRLLVTAVPRNIFQYATGILQPPTQQEDSVSAGSSPMITVTLPGKLDKEGMVVTRVDDDACPSTTTTTTSTTVTSVEVKIDSYSSLCPPVLGSVLELKGKSLKNLLATFNKEGAAEEEGDSGEAKRDCRYREIHHLFRKFGPCEVKSTPTAGGNYSVEVHFLSELPKIRKDNAENGRRGGGAEKTLSPMGVACFAPWNALEACRRLQFFFAKYWALCLTFKDETPRLTAEGSQEKEQAAMAARGSGGDTLMVSLNRNLHWEHLLGETGLRLGNLCPLDGRCKEVNDKHHREEWGHTCTNQGVCKYKEDQRHNRYFRHH